MAHWITFTDHDGDCISGTNLPHQCTSMVIWCHCEQTEPC